MKTTRFDPARRPRELSAIAFESPAIASSVRRFHTRVSEEFGEVGMDGVQLLGMLPAVVIPDEVGARDVRATVDAAQDVAHYFTVARGQVRTASSVACSPQGAAIDVRAAPGRPRRAVLRRDFDDAGDACWR